MQKFDSRKKCERFGHSTECFQFTRKVVGWVHQLSRNLLAQNIAYKILNEFPLQRCLFLTNYGVSEIGKQPVFSYRINNNQQY